MTIVANAFEMVTTAMITGERKIFVLSWHTRFKIYKEKRNNSKLTSKLLFHLNNDTLKKSIFLLEFFLLHFELSYIDTINYTIIYHCNSSVDGMRIDVIRLYEPY